MLSYKEKEVLTVESFKKIIKNKVRGISLVPKKTTHILRKRNKKSSLNLKSFNRVIHIDKEKQEAEVEGCVNFRDLVKETLKHGLIPKIVPELSSITVGGTVSGLGVESGSFKYGVVQETIKEATVLTGRGEIVECSPSVNEDLFNSLPNSFGSLGYVLKCKMGLLSAKPYVEIQVIRFFSLYEYFEKLESECKKQDYDFIDGVVYSKNHQVAVLGRMISKLPPGKKPFNLFTNIYYKVLEKSLDGSKLFLEIEDYLFRWDKDAFWGMESYPILRLFLGNKLLRATILRPILRTDKLLAIKKYREKLMNFIRKINPLITTRYEELIQDFGIDIKKSSEFIEWYDKEIGVYPLWICPLKKVQKEGMYPLFDFKAEFIIDLGFYAILKLDKSVVDDYYLKIGEAKVQEMGGMKGLYSKNLYTQEEFWKIYNKDGYYKVKQKYDPDSVFPGVYQKISRG